MTFTVRPVPFVLPCVQNDVEATSSTNLQAGLDLAAAQLRGCRPCMEAGRNDTENRILLITDAQPNTGDFTTDGLAARLKASAADGIHTTLVGERAGGPPVHGQARGSLGSACWGEGSVASSSAIAGMVCMLERGCGTLRGVPQP